MPMYAFECSGCGETRVREMAVDEWDDFKRHHSYATHNDDIPHFGAHIPDNQPTCGFWFRTYNFHFNRGMVDHFSTTLNRPISSDRQFNDELKRQSEEMSARMGFDVNYAPVDPTDPVAAGVKGDAGFESQERAHFDPDNTPSRTFT